MPSSMGGGMKSVSHREAQCNVGWQVLRISTMPRYNSKGGWDTPEGTYDNLQRLGSYWQRGYYIGLPEYSRRVYRVRSLLLHVLREYRNAGSWATDRYQQVLNVCNGLPRLQVQVVGEQGLWGAVKRDLKHLLEENPDVYNDVRREIGGFLRSAQGDTTAMQTFYDMMQEVSA